MDYDLIIIGSGPGGYVAAIRAAQLKMKVAVVERAEVGGICLNWGCIPTKSLLKSAQVFEYLSHASDYGISVTGEFKPDFRVMVSRSRGVADGMSKGVQFLFRKNSIEHIKGFGRLKGKNSVEIDDTGSKKTFTAKNIIVVKP
jgi:dihydrolipoamide dehydrogenase